MQISRYLSTVSLLLVATLPVAAHADTFDFSAIGVSGLFNGSGTLTTTSQMAANLITASSSTGVPGLIAPNGFRGNHNLLFFPLHTPAVESNEFIVTDANAPDYFNVNIFDDGSGYFAYIQDQDNFIQFVPVNAALSRLPAVPEPSTFFLLGTGLLGAAAMLRRRILSKAPSDVYESNDPGAEDLSTPTIP